MNSSLLDGHDFSLHCGTLLECQRIPSLRDQMIELGHPLVVLSTRDLLRMSFSKTMR